MLHKIRQIMHRHRLTACTAAAVVALVAYAASCSNIDCPLNNKVELACGFYNSETNGSTTIGDNYYSRRNRQHTVQLRIQHIKPRPADELHERSGYVRG